MKRSLKTKLIAGIAAASMLMPLAACSKKDGPLGTATQVAENAPWYESEKIVLESGLDVSTYDYVYSQYIGEYNGGYVMAHYGYRNYAAEGVSNSEELLCCYDGEGKLINSVNINDLLKSEGFSADNTSLDDIVCRDGKVSATLGSFDEKTEEVTMYDASLDLESGKIISLTERAGEDKATEGLSYEGSTEVAGYTIKKYWKSGEDDGSVASYVLTVTSPDGTEGTIDLTKLLPNEEIYDMPMLLDIGDDKAIFPVASSNSFKITYKVIDLKALTVAKYDKDMSWLNLMDLYSLTEVPGSGYITKDSDCIKMADFKKGEMKEIVNFNDTNVNRSDIENLQVVSVDDKSVILAGNSSNRLVSGDAVIIKLTKADKNPNVGKTIIRLAVVNGSDYAVSEAVCKFNAENKDYVIQYDNSYTLMNNIDLASLTMDDQDELQSGLYGALGKMENKLAMDLMAGEGPDIIIGGTAFPQLNNDQYMTDLTSDLDLSGLSSNIIDASKTDGKLFQLPITLIVEGMAMEKSIAPSGKTGFTYDEYKKFIDEKCNGTTPFDTYSQKDVLVTFLSAMYKDFVDGDSVNFDNDSFRKTCKFVKENVKDGAVFTEMSENGEYTGDHNADSCPVELSTLYSFSNYLQLSKMRGGAEIALLGIPSVDGRGPILAARTSVGVSAETPSRDGCIAFVKILISEDIQMTAGRAEMIPVNTNALKKTSEEILKEENDRISYNLENLPASQIAAMNLPSKTIDEKTADEFAGLITGAKNIDCSDSAIINIVREEIPAYLEGQKDIDDVIDIINDRAQKVVDERG